MVVLREEYGEEHFAEIFKIITADNGPEFERLSELEAWGIGVYFAHPYSSWERPQNERHNRLFRRHIPKGVSIDNYSAEQILSFVDQMNALPRRILGCCTPEELFDAFLDQVYSLNRIRVAWFCLEFKLDLQSLLQIICLLSSACVILLLAACGGEKNAIVGTWVPDRGSEIVIFEENGSCTAPFTYNASWWETADRYVMKEDGTLVLSSPEGHAGGEYEKVSSEEEAYSDWHTYYLSGDRLIIETDGYTRSK